MSRKLISVGILSLILAPGAALSLGMGEIRLSSHLNQPMNAEIPLSIASQAELEGLRVELASVEAFQQRGLDRPQFFDDLRFQVQATGANSAVVYVSSTRPITEPFVTFLLEARWSGGRVLREYTVLLDPPIFMPSAEYTPVPAPASAPAVTETRRPAPAPDADPAPVARPAPAPAPVAAPVAARPSLRDDYSVQRNDTLWGIAQRLQPDETLTTNQIMLALFQENPHAFDGNINRLRSGTILRVPSREQMAAMSRDRATAEVRRQTDEWRSAAPAPAVVERRLELAPPAEVARPAAAVSDPVPAAAAPSGDLLEAIQVLRGELADTRSLIEVRDAEIAALQARLAEIESARAPDTAPVEGADRPVVAPAAVTPAAEQAPAQPVAEGRPAVVPPAPEPTLLDRATSLLGNLWFWLVLAMLALVAAAGVILRNRRDQERSIEQDLAETGTWGTLDTSGKLALATASAGAGVAAARVQPRRPVREPEAIVVEEADAPAPRGVAAVPPPQESRPGAEADASAEEEFHYPFEDTIAGEAGINLDQTDPMSEADFHMAYGLYDQAADIVKKAIERDPDRYELRRKLIDICFVWGNAPEFLEQARAIQKLDDETAAADWAKIAIMGRQICPDEALFQSAGGASEVDVELGGETGVFPVSGTGGDWLDFDVGESKAASQPLGDTREQPAPRLDSSKPDQTAELNLEELGIDLDLGESGEHALQDLAERAPEIFDEAEDELSGGTLRLSDPAAGGEAGGADDEEAGDGTLMLDTSQARRRVEDPTQRGEGWELAEDEPTMADVDGLEEVQRQTVVIGKDVADDEPTGTGFGGFVEEEDEVDRTLIRKVQLSAEAPTTEVGGFEDEDDVNLDLDDLTEALKIDLEVPAEESEMEDEVESTRLTKALEPEPEEPVELGDTAEMPPSEMDEIGTKLDLARAYIDMGDPDGARSILDEVIEEGNDGQRNEARELLESLA